MKFNLICASHDDQILSQNLAASIFFQNNQQRNTVMKGYRNIPEAYEVAMKICLGDEYNLMVHHDVFLPNDFQTDLEKAIIEINSIDDNWGVLGVAGARLENGKRKFFGHVQDRGKEWGSVLDLPQEVQTLDELLLITHGDLIFDEQFDLHFYGADICMQAMTESRKNYAIDAYVHHNSTLKPGFRSDSFNECELKFRNKWRDFLPIVTTCSLIQ